MYKTKSPVIDALDMAIESLSADVVRFEVYRDLYGKYIELKHKTEWITDRKPTEDGEYMVTLDAFERHRFVEIFAYGKPLMPNREVKGKCWYRSDDEWGDVVYDDEDILAWRPLPKPYSERR